MNLRKARRYLVNALTEMPNSFSVEQTLLELKSAGINVVSATLDHRAVEDFTRRAEYEFYYPAYYHGRDLVKLKKIREHFVASELLKLHPGDVYVDIASQVSPAPQVYERLFGCTVYRQDWDYVPGKHGRLLGGSASNMALESGSVTKMALHCSLEHFEGDEDIGFMKEAERLLTIGGLLAIVPLYLCDEYFICTQPALWMSLPRQKWPVFDRDAVIYCPPGAANRHERYYDVRGFVQRIVENTNMHVTVHSFGDSPVCHTGQLRFAAVFEKT